MVVLYSEENFKIVKISKENFYNNKAYFIQNFNDISNSNDIEETIDLDFIFSESLSNSIICAIINSEIVSYIVARELHCFWHIDYIKTHYNFQRRGIGKKILLMCINDILCLGGEKISYISNDKSKNLFNSIALERKDLDQIDEGMMRKAIVKKISR